MSVSQDTMMFKAGKSELTPKEVLQTVYEALEEKGYDPINQLVGYILSGDPVYITSYKNARSLIGKIERHELVEEIVSSYLSKN